MTNMGKILTIASRKSPLRHGKETMENRRASARVFSALMGSLECLALQALDGRNRQNRFCNFKFRNYLGNRKRKGEDYGKIRRAI